MARNFDLLLERVMRTGRLGEYAETKPARG
jgi:hypothetical protein